MDNQPSITVSIRADVRDLVVLLDYYLEVGVVSTKCSLVRRAMESYVDDLIAQKKAVRLDDPGIALLRLGDHFGRQSLREAKRLDRQVAENVINPERDALQEAAAKQLREEMADD